MMYKYISYFILFEIVCRDDRMIEYGNYIYCSDSQIFFIY